MAEILNEVRILSDRIMELGNVMVRIENMVKGVHHL